MPPTPPALSPAPNLDRRSDPWPSVPPATTPAPVPTLALAHTHKTHTLSLTHQTSETTRDRENPVPGRSFPAPGVRDSLSRLRGRGRREADPAGDPGTGGRARAAAAGRGEAGSFRPPGERGGSKRSRASAGAQPLAAPRGHGAAGEGAGRATRHEPGRERDSQDKRARGRPSPLPRSPRRGRPYS